MTQLQVIIVAILFTSQALGYYLGDVPFIPLDVKALPMPFASLPHWSYLPLTKRANIDDVSKRMVDDVDEHDLDVYKRNLKGEDMSPNKKLLLVQGLILKNGDKINDDDVTFVKKLINMNLMDMNDIMNDRKLIQQKKVAKINDFMQNLAINEQHPIHNKPVNQFLMNNHIPMVNQRNLNEITALEIEKLETQLLDSILSQDNVKTDMDSPMSMRKMVDDLNVIKFQKDIFKKLGKFNDKFGAADLAKNVNSGILHNSQQVKDFNAQLLKHLF